MKKLSLIALGLLLSFSALAAGDLGLGFMVGQPTGITAKKIIADGQAVDVGAGWSIGGNGHFQIHGDWLFNKQDALIWNDQDPVDVYFGAGARMKFANEIELGLRIPVGMAFYMSDRQIELFGEVAPIFDFVPTAEWEAQMLVGMRYYF